MAYYRKKRYSRTPSRRSRSRYSFSSRYGYSASRKPRRKKRVAKKKGFLAKIFGF